MTIVYDPSRQLPSPDYSGLLNWSVQQPIFRSTAAQYIADARELTPRFEEAVQNFTQQFNFPINIKIAEPKSLESAERKLWDRKASHINRPEMLKDYGRGTIIVPTASQSHHNGGVEYLDDVIHRLVHSTNTVAYKDQFLRPNTETGYRSFKAIWEISGHNFELLVDYAGMADANMMTKHLRSIERSLKDFERELPQRCISKADSEADRKAAKMTVQVEEGIQAMRDARLGISEMYASQCGLNRLLDTALQPFHGDSVANAFLSAAKSSKSTFAKPALGIISRAEQLLFSSPVQAYH